MPATLFALALLPSLAVAPPQTKPTKTPDRVVEARKWEHESSDLKPDPKINFGALKNGMRYAWVDNAEPKKQLFLRLHVNIGSLVETDAEQGMAHFVEHMAFNGTTSFKAGTLVDTFQKQGIKFGHDVNAHTSMEETVYELDLPDAEPERLKKSLQWFRDIVNGLKMEEKEVQAEKGVIDSEERDRGGEGFQTLVELLNKSLDGTLPPKRLPIGIKDVRAKFNAKSCLAFYKRWYRPEHVTFVLVGDLGGLEPAKLIEDAFATIPVPKDPLPLRPDLGRPTFKYKGFGLEHSVFPSFFGRGSASIVVARLRPGTAKAWNSQTIAADVTDRIVDMMASQRFDERREKDKLPFGNVSVADVDSLLDAQGVVAGPALVVSCEKEKWREALMAAERELRRIVERGFTADELRKAYIQHDRTLVPRPKLTAPHSLEYVQELLAACNGHYVPMEDRDAKEVRKVGARKLNDVAIANKAFQDEWKQGELVIITMGGIQLGADPAAELMEIWNAAKATDLDQPLPVKSDVTAKADKPEGGGEPGTPEKPADPGATNATDPAKETRKVDPNAFAYGVPDVIKDATATVNRMDDLRVVDVAFKNGVKASYKRKSDAGFSFGRYEVRVGEGLLALDPSKRAVAWVAENFLMAGGLAKNDWETVQAAGGGSVDFSVEGDACVFTGALFGGDLKRSFEVICAYLTDAALRPEAFDEFRKKIPERLKPAEEAADAKPSLGSLRRKFDEQLYAAEPRLLPPSQAAAEAVTLDEVKSFLKSQLDGPIAITAVGIDALKFEKALFSTFAKLPQRRAAKDYESRRAIAPLRTGLVDKHDVETGGQSALIHMVYPATDRLDPVTGRKLELLEDVVMDRLRVEIREKRGGAYSPNGSVWASSTWKGLGWITLDVGVDPAKVDEMTKACATAMETLGTKGITQAELDRLRAAHLGDVDTALKDDSLWFEALKVAHSRPQSYDDLRNYKASYEKITVADLNALCKQFLVKGRESVFVAIPKK